MNDEKIKKGIKNIRKCLKRYLERFPMLKSLVIGVSGGIDSALCVALAEPVCNEMDVQLVGRSLPIVTNKDNEKKNARMIGNAFEMDFKEVSLTECYNLSIRYYLAEFDKVDLSERGWKIRKGNIKARTRMIYLYNLAHARQGIVLSTDNLTEYLLGFWTIAGDIGDFGMIQNVWKNEVYKMAKFLVDDYKNSGKYEKTNALQKCIDIPSTDGLGITNTSLEQLNATSFDEIDAELREFLKDPEKGDINSPIIQRHLRTYFKRNHPYNIPRKNIFPNETEDSL